MKTLFLTVFSVGLATAAMAAPIQVNIGVDEGKCEVVSVGQFLCKIGGKCYYCDRNKDVNPKKHCYEETTCAAAMGQSDDNGLVTRPARFVMRPSDDDHDREHALTPSVLCQRTE